MNKVNNQDAIVLDSDGDNYDVSICIITYNKEKYIEECIKSVLLQKTSCKYEIVVGDNASSDKTREILEKYWENDKEKFTIILNNSNLGLTTNMYNTMLKAKGKYIIILYGDDYWISEYKLQTQFDYLESHPDELAISSAINFIYDGESNAFCTAPSAKIKNTKCTLEKYLNGYDFPMAGVMFRNDVFSSNESHFHKMLASSLFIDDSSFCILLLMLGDVYVIGEPMGAYRCFKKNAGSSNFNAVNPKIKRDKMNLELLNNLDIVTNSQLDLSMRYGFVLSSSFLAFLKREISFIEYKDLIEMLPTQYAKKRISILCKGIWRKLSLL